MDVREKLVELIESAENQRLAVSLCCTVSELIDIPRKEEYIADHLIAHGVTVQEHGCWETVVEVRDNTVCGNGVKIEYKRCSCCKNPAKFFEDDFCGNCGAKLDLPQPPKGE